MIEIMIKLANFKHVHMIKVQKLIHGKSGIQCFWAALFHYMKFICMKIIPIQYKICIQSKQNSVNNAIKMQVKKITYPKFAIMNICLKHINHMFVFALWQNVNFNHKIFKLCFIIYGYNFSSSQESITSSLCLKIINKRFCNYNTIVMGHIFSNITFPI